MVMVRTPWMVVSIFAGQEDDAVRAIQRDFRQREVREGERLGEHRLAVAVLAGEGGGAVGMHPQPPELEGFDGHALCRRCAKAMSSSSQ